MNKILVSLIALGWIDILNPTGISFMLILLQSVKKRWHALLFAIFSYIAFATGGLAIFVGIDVVFKNLYKWFCSEHFIASCIIKFAIGIICLVGCIAMCKYLYGAAKRKETLTLDKMMPIKSVSPWFIIGFALVSTWSELFSCVNLVAFAGILSYENVGVMEATVWMFLFSVFMLIPTVGVYILSIKVKGEKFQKIINTTGKIATYFCFYCIPVLLAVGAWWGIISGLKLFS